MYCVEGYQTSPKWKHTLQTPSVISVLPSPCSPQINHGNSWDYSNNTAPVHLSITLFFFSHFVSFCCSFTLYFVWWNCLKLNGQEGRMHRNLRKPKGVLREAQAQANSQTEQNECITAMGNKQEEHIIPFKSQFCIKILFKGFYHQTNIFNMFCFWVKKL